jgi:hypothetical protein
MTPKEQMEFRSLQGLLMEIVGRGADRHELLQHTERTEHWIDRLVDKYITAAVAPYVNVHISTDNKKERLK